MQTRYDGLDMAEISGREELACGEKNTKHQGGARLRTSYKEGKIGRRASPMHRVLLGGRVANMGKRVKPGTVKYSVALHTGSSYYSPAVLGHGKLELGGARRLQLQVVPPPSGDIHGNSSGRRGYGGERPCQPEPDLVDGESGRLWGL